MVGRDSVEPGNSHFASTTPRSVPAYGRLSLVSDALRVQKSFMTLAPQVRPLNRVTEPGLAALVICASVFAGASKDQAVATKQHRVVQKVIRKPCRVSFGGSAIPEPCDRLGEFPSTASPMHIIGGSPVAQKGR